MSTKKMQLLNAVAHGAEFTPGVVAKTLGFSSSLVGVYLIDFQNQGLVTKLGRARYQITQAGINKVGAAEAAAGKTTSRTIGVELGILGYMNIYPERSYSAAVLCKYANLSEAQTLDVLESFADEGWVERTGRGNFRITEAGLDRSEQLEAEEVRQSAVGQDNDTHTAEEAA